MSMPDDLFIARPAVDKRDGGLQCFVPPERPDGPVTLRCIDNWGEGEICLEPSECRQLAAWLLAKAGEMEARP